MKTDRNATAQTQSNVKLTLPEHGYFHNLTTKRSNEILQHLDAPIEDHNGGHIEHRAAERLPD